MNIQTCALVDRMIAYDAGDVKRIAHFMKVYAYAKAIGELEGLDADQQYVLELSAITHDVGIHESLRRYGNTSGKNQELLGPPIARQMLLDLGTDTQTAERVCAVIGRHHTYGTDYGVEHQILIEADFLVNAQEDAMDRETIRHSGDIIFRTETGKRFLTQLFALDDGMEEWKDE